MISIDGVLSIKDDNWSMCINLRELIDTTGICRTEIDAFGNRWKYTITKVYEARRILKFLLPYATTADIAWMDEEFKANPALMKIWKSLRG